MKLGGRIQDKSQRDEAKKNILKKMKEDIAELCMPILNCTSVFSLAL